MTVLVFSITALVSQYFTILHYFTEQLNCMRVSFAPRHHVKHMRFTNTLPKLSSMIVLPSDPTELSLLPNRR